MANPGANGCRTLLVSFSGVDGSGKSTQIDHLNSFLCEQGLRVRTMAFWDEVVVFTRYREGFVHKVYGSEKGIGAPGRPVQRRDKNVRSWYLSLARHFLYLADAIHLKIVVRRAMQSADDVVIMDRYIYDELANLPLSNPLTRAFVRLLAALVPRPDVALVLDADPDAARQRKPEYPVDFMRECRKSYLRLAAMLRTLMVIPPLSLPAAQKEVESAVRRKLSERGSSLLMPERVSAQ